jgi:hypothetical protein
MSSFKYNFFLKIAWRKLRYEKTIWFLFWFWFFEGRCSYKGKIRKQTFFSYICQLLKNIHKFFKNIFHFTFHLIVMKIIFCIAENELYMIFWKILKSLLLFFALTQRISRSQELIFLFFFWFLVFTLQTNTHNYYDFTWNVLDS